MTKIAKFYSLETVAFGIVSKHSNLHLDFWKEFEMSIEKLESKKLEGGDSGYFIGAFVIIVVALVWVFIHVSPQLEANKARNAVLVDLSPIERRDFDEFEQAMRSGLRVGDVLVIQSSRDGEIFTRTLQSRDKNGDLTFLESNRSGQVLVVHSPENTVSLLQIFGQLISIKIERNFHVPTTTKPSPPSAVGGFFSFLNKISLPVRSFW